MNQDHQEYNGSKPNDHALIRKPSSAVEKFTPGASRILSGAVSEALALVKTPVFTVLMCDDQVSDAAQFVLHKELSHKYRLRFIRFRTATELVRLTQESAFDLVFMYLGNVDWDTGERHRFNTAVEVLRAIRSKYRRPIIATQGADLLERFAKTGVTFIEAPWTLESFQKALDTSLAIRFSSPRIIVIDDEPMLLFLNEVTINNYFENITIRFFTDGELALREIEDVQPDLLISDMNRYGMEGWQMLPILARMKAVFPIFVNSGNATEGEVRRCAGPTLNISFMQKPWECESFAKRVGILLKIPPNLALVNEIATSRTKRPKFILVNDESWLLETMTILIRKQYPYAIIQTFDNSKKAWIELGRYGDFLPYVLITDDLMAEIGGMDIIRRLTEKKSSYPVIVTTGFDRDELRQCVRECANKGLNVRLVNCPFGIEEFSSAIEECLNELGKTQ